MRRIAILTLLAFGFLATLAVAASVHFKPKGPTFTDNGTTLTVNGTLAGLGEEDVVITVEANGTATTVGYNRGGNTAPGQNVQVTETGNLTISASEIQHGEVFFSLTTPSPPNPTAKQAGLPNSHWTAVITKVTFTSVTITVMQGGETVLNQTYKL
jgi:hypothetical protein